MSKKAIASQREVRRRATHAKAVELVRRSLEMTAEAGSGHPTSAASLAHLITVLLYDHMRWDPSEPDDPRADRLVLSEGHACPVVYAAGADLGIAIDDPRRPGPARRPMTWDDALELRSIGSPVEGHPNPRHGFPFFPAATGSLGQGLSIAAGIALGARTRGLSKRVFCILGDGESREGQVWEALDFLVDQALTEVCPIFNANGQGQTGDVSHQQSADLLAAKLRAFGFEDVVFDGHLPDQVLAALGRHAERSEGARSKPVALVARTIKGWGTPRFADAQGGRHGKPPGSPEELAEALRELEETARRIGAQWTEGVLQIPALPEAPHVDLPPTTAAPPSLPALEEDRLATRKAFGLALRALGDARPDVVVLDGDVSNSTYSGTFLEGDGESAARRRARFFEGRIAEQNLVSCATGLASEGLTPFVATFGKFLTRAYDQVEMALVGGAPLRLVGSHAGVSLAADGPSQMALPDAAWFASLGRVRRDGRPLVHVLTPSDAVSAYALTLAMAEHEGATYLRTLRPDVPILHDRGTTFEIGGHEVIEEGGDVLCLAWGYLVHVLLEAARSLRAQGIAPTVVDLYSLPFDEERIAELAKENGSRVLVLEDNYGGALGAAVTEALESGDGELRLRRMFVRAVPGSGRTPEAVLASLGLAPADVVEEVRTLVAGSAA